jgi:hypothetical protein
LKAGRQAVARSAMVEAVAQLEKGLELLATMPSSRGHQQQELDLRLALGAALAATRGYSSPQVGEAFTRASELAEQVDEPGRLLPILYGQFGYHLVRSEHRLALPFAQRMESSVRYKMIPQRRCWVTSFTELVATFLVSSLLPVRSTSSAITCAIQQFATLSPI